MYILMIFKLTNEVFDNPLRKENSHARLHLLQLCIDEEIKGRGITQMSRNILSN